MKKSFKTIGVVTVFMFLAGLAGAIALPGGSALAAEKVVKWKCQVHWPTSSTSYQDSLMDIVNRVKKATNGGFIIEPFPTGSFVPGVEIYNAVSRGMFEMGSSGITYFQNRVPLAAVGAGLPYSFKSYMEAVYFNMKLGYEQMLKDACAKDGVFYATDKVYGHELSMQVPITKMEDFKGLKLRSAGPNALFLNLVGAAAAYLPGPEIYPALASKVVVGAHWGAAQGSRDMGFYEVNKYHLKPAISIGGSDGWLVNQKALDKLPEKYRDVLVTILNNQIYNRTAEYEILEELALAEVQKTKGVTLCTIDPESQKKMTRLAMKLWDDVAAKSPENAKAVEILVQFLKDLGHLD